VTFSARAVVCVSLRAPVLPALAKAGIAPVDWAVRHTRGTVSQVVSCSEMFPL
jgi:hypothetical protein